MTHQEASDRLQTLLARISLSPEHAEHVDLESAHVEADDILCDLLRSLGHGDVVDKFERVNKWYS